MADQTIKINCLLHDEMRALLEDLAPQGVQFTKRRFWHIWRPDFTITAPAEFMPTLRARLDAALALDDIERRAW